VIHRLCSTCRGFWSGEIESADVICDFGVHHPYLSPTSGRRQIALTKRVLKNLDRKRDPGQ
jgi:hypothetical protein